LAAILAEKPKIFSRNPSPCSSSPSLIAPVAPFEALDYHKLQDVTSQHLAAYKSARRVEGAKPRTVNLELALGWHAFNLAIREWEWCTSNPFLQVKPERVPADQERWLTAEEERTLLGHSPPWLQRLITVALYTGLRLGEILSLRWEAVDLGKGHLVVHTVLSKTSRARTVPLSQTVSELLTQGQGKQGPSSTGFVFCTKSGKAYAARNVERNFRQAVHKAKIAPVRFHDLRHTFATRLVQAGVDLYTVQRLLGHTSPTMTQRYAHHSTQSLQAAVEVLEKTQKP